MRTRWQLACIATLASHAPSAKLLPLLKQLLDEDLRQWRAFKHQAVSDGYRQGPATNEARMSWVLQYRQAFDAIGGTETAMLMREYLSDEDFGQSAALILAEQWLAANEPSDSNRLRGAVDFSRVEGRRAARSANPAATSAEAEGIFNAIEPLIADDATANQKEHAVALGVVAARLPHGERDATIKKLISMAPRRARADLLQNLILSGEIIEIGIVRDGIAELLEAAKTQRWVLSDRGYELKEWLRLLPFTSFPADAITIVGTLPDEQRRVAFLEDMVAAFAAVPSKDAEDVLFRLGEGDARFYTNHAWRDAIIGRGTASAAQRIVDLAANSAFDGGSDDWHLARQIGGLMGEHSELRTYVYGLLKSGPTLPGFTLIANAVAQQPDAAGLLLLVQMEIEHKHSFVTRHTIEAALTKLVPAENWKGAYNVVPLPAAEIRRELLGITTDGGPNDVAARCLRQIDEIREEYGGDESDFPPS